MKRLSHPALESYRDCPYLPERRLRMESFFALELGAAEVDSLFREGWRKFGAYFFRPKCDSCRECVPLRVPVNAFTPTRSQRRVLAKNRDLEVSFAPLEYSDEIYSLYREHSKDRFAQESNLDEFMQAFYWRSCPALQSEYRLDGQLIAAGFLDLGSRSWSSVYFVFGSRFAARSLGTYGALREIEEARIRGLEHYYLGYHVAGCDAMTYKARFRPHESMDWDTFQWR